jgi:hypothetical protein
VLHTILHGCPCQCSWSGQCGLHLQRDPASSKMHLSVTSYRPPGAPFFVHSSHRAIAISRHLFTFSILFYSYVQSGASRIVRRTTINSNPPYPVFDLRQLHPIACDTPSASSQPCIHVGHEEMADSFDGFETRGNLCSYRRVSRDADIVELCDFSWYKEKCMSTRRSSVQKRYIHIRHRIGPMLHRHARY